MPAERGVMARVRSYDTTGILGQGLNASMLRHSILADNIANIDTPGFKRSDVSFQAELSRALDDSPRIEMARGSERHFETQPSRHAERVRPRVFAELDTWTRNDKNNVDPEVEMSRVSENVLYYQTLTGRVGAKFRSLNNVISRTPTS